MKQEQIRISYIIDGEEISRASLNLNDHEIVDVVTSEKHRRLGYAQLLVKELISIAVRQNLPRVFATVHQDNEASKALWKSLGFGVPFLKYEKRIK